MSERCPHSESGEHVRGLSTRTCVLCGADDPVEPLPSAAIPAEVQARAISGSSEADVMALLAELRRAMSRVHDVAVQSVLLEAVGEIGSLWERATGAEAALDAERQQQRVELRALIDALRPFAVFAAAWNRKPIKGIANDIYTIHAGEDEASLRLSDCQQALRTLSALDAAVPGGSASEWRVSLTASECAALARGCRLTKWLDDGIKLTLQATAVPGAREEEHDQH